MSCFFFLFFCFGVWWSPLAWCSFFFFFLSTRWACCVSLWLSVCLCSFAASRLGGVPVVVWRVGDDAQRGVVDFHRARREFDDNGLASRFGHHEVNRRGDADGRLDDADDANLRERIPHFFNRPTGGEQVLADIQG